MNEQKEEEQRKASLEEMQEETREFWNYVIDRLTVSKFLTELNPDQLNMLEDFIDEERARRKELEDEEEPE